MIAPLSVRPDPDQAREWLRDELGRAAYQRSLFQRFTDWANEQLNEMLNAAASAGVPSVIGALLLLVVVILVVGVVVSRLRVESAGRAQPPVPLGIDSRLSAAEHRTRAQAALAAGRHEEGVVEAVRALSRALIDRTVLTDDPGTTAHEMSLAAGPAFPAYAARLASAADLFDGVQYGDRPASADDVRRLLALDSDLAGTRPVDVSTMTFPAVPR